MPYNSGINPFIGVLVLLALLYVLLKVYNIDIADFFKTSTFSDIYGQHPLIVIVTIAVIVYAAYIVYKTLISMSNNENFGTTQPINISSIPNQASLTQTSSSVNVNANARPETFHKVETVVMSFDRFYQTFVMVETFDETNESESQSQLSQSESESYSLYKNGNTESEEITYVVPDNRVVIFRTDVDGIKYYMVMKSLLEQDLPYRKTNIYQDIAYADKAALCKIGGTVDRFICPVLLREDLLDQEYRKFVDAAYLDTAKAVEIKKVTDNIDKNNALKSLVSVESLSVLSESEYSSKYSSESSFKSESKSRSESESESEAISALKSKTDAQRVLQHDVIPRYIHHFTMVRQIPTLESLILSDVIKSEFDSESYQEYEQKEHKNTNAEKYCYLLSGYLKDQLKDITQLNTESPYMINLSKNFSPFTTLRKEEVIEKINDGSVESEIANKQMVDIVNDRKFVCATQSIDVLKYSELFASTIAPSLDSTPIPLTSTSIVSNQSSSAAFILTGANNTDIVKLSPLVNLYVLGDFKNANQVAFNNVKCWLARLDTYVDPTINTGSEVIVNDPYNDKSSPYYRKPRIYNVGIIPDDYKQCTTLPDGTIDSFCRGEKYINGIDFSDARKISFEVATVQLNSI